MPETFVAVMGIEKVIPQLRDLSHFLEILARTATGQKLTTYTSFITGPRREGELDGPARDARGDSGQRAQRDAGGSGPARSAVLHALRRVPQRMPGLPANRRPRVQLGVSGSDRIDHQPESVRQRRRHICRSHRRCAAPARISARSRSISHESCFTCAGKRASSEHPLKWPRADQRARDRARAGSPGWRGIRAPYD